MSDDISNAHEGLPPLFVEIVKKYMYLMSPEGCGGLRMFHGKELVPLWEAVRQGYGSEAPPYWGWAWPGSIALSRYLVDHPETVRGCQVLDLGAGNALTSLAAKQAGAAHCIANDIDPLAMYMAAAHQRLNGLDIELLEHNLLADDPAAIECDVILVGDMFYERQLAGTLKPWLQRACALDRIVLIGDPGRNYPPEGRIQELASYTLQLSLEVENTPTRNTRVLKMN
jgi:predicted nicotinamide N-methyase